MEWEVVAISQTGMTGVALPIDTGLNCKPISWATKLTYSDFYLCNETFPLLHFVEF